jgi:hypothetical protein
MSSESLDCSIYVFSTLHVLVCCLLRLLGTTALELLAMSSPAYKSQRVLDQLVKAHQCRCEFEPWVGRISTCG